MSLAAKKHSSFSSFGAAFRFIKNGLLGVLEIAEQRGSVPPPVIQLFTTCLSIFQMFSFVTQNAGAYSWPPSLSPLAITSSLTSVSGYRQYM